VILGGKDVAGTPLNLRRREGRGRRRFRDDQSGGKLTCPQSLA